MEEEEEEEEVEVEVEVVLEEAWRPDRCWRSHRSSRGRGPDSPCLSLPGPSSWTSGPDTAPGPGAALPDTSGHL